MNGVDVLVDEAVPTPAALRALTRNVYAVPFVRPVTRAVVDVVPVLAVTSVQFAPKSVERSMR